MQAELPVIPAERIAALKLKRVYLAEYRRKSNEKKGFIIL
jgi:hypothetical protein